MGTISAKKIQDALSQAQNLGLVEEPCTINGCSLVLRSLRPDEYAAALTDCKDIDNQVEYLNEFQRAHITRSIVEVNGVDLREADFIEVEEEVKNPQTGQMEPKLIKLERAAYLKKYVIKSWGRESVYTAYRKFNDAEKRADEEAKKNIQFYTPEETAEDKVRRLIVELKEVEEEIPEQLLNQLLDEYGYMRKSTAEEVKAAMERLDQEARDKETAAKAAAAPPAGQPQTPVQQAAPTPQGPPAVDLSQRQPLNRRPVQIPPDPHVVAQQAAQQIRDQVQVAQGGRAPQPAVADPSVLKKAQEIAALEGEAGTGLDIPPAPGSAQTPTHLPGPGGQNIPVVNLNSGVAELVTKGQDRIDPKALRLDQPPTGGINPKYRPQQR